MKRLIVAVILLLALLFSCFAGYTGLDQVTEDLANRVTKADSLLLASGESSAQTALEEAYRLWRSRQKLLGALVRHNELDDIENLFQRAMQSLDDGELHEYRLHSRELQGMLRHIPEMEQPSIQNIF